MMPRRTRGWRVAPSVSSTVLKPLPQKRSPELIDTPGECLLWEALASGIKLTPFCKTLAFMEGGHKL